MVGDIQVIDASCHCGAFSIKIPTRDSSLPLSAHLCHCDTCRRSSGTLCVTYLPLHDLEFLPDPSVLDQLTGYKSSAQVTRWFCSNCGCHALWDGPAKDNWELATGCMAQLQGVVELKRHVFIEDTIDGGSSDWILGASLDRGAAQAGELTTSQYDSTGRENVIPSARLHAHCSCGGINMYIARPSSSSEKTCAPPPDVLAPADCGHAKLSADEAWWLRAEKTKFLGGLCACNSCRLVTGFELIGWAYIPTSDISLDPEGQIPFSREFGTLKAYRSSDDATRRFCSVCGATVFFDGDVRPGVVDVAVGLLDAPEGARAGSWLEWATERVSHRKDADPRASGFIETVERHLRLWGKNVQGEEGPRES